MAKKRPWYVGLMVVSVWCLMMGRAYATLDLELTSGVDQALPIAVLPFTQPSSPMSKVSKIIAADLQHSGQFRLVPSQRAPKHADSNYRYWRNQGVDYVIAGKVQSFADSHYGINFDVLDPMSQTHRILSQHYRIAATKWRALAHHISDVIYKKLTGDEGIFSTRLVYIAVQHPHASTKRYALMVADADGFNEHVLVASSTPMMSPAWSPDGKKIAYVSFEHKRSQIFVINIMTGKRSLLTHYPGINGAPAWSPNGREIALVLSKSGQPHIYVLNLANHHLQMLTHGNVIDTEPNFAPDGQSILFTSDRGGSPQIYRLKLQNHQVKRLTFDGHYNARASFTPDGKAMVMLHYANGLFTIAMQNLESGDVTLLTQSNQGDSPSIAANGKMVAYATHAKGQGVLALVSTDGRVHLRLPSHDEDVQEPAWSPFLH